MILARPLIPLFLLLPLLLHGEDIWKMQFYYSKLDSAMDIRDIQCPSVQRCIAAGVIVDTRNGREKGVALVTSDGGKQWSTIEVKERPVSLFFLDDSRGWMVTDRGVWSTAESGRSWTKLEGLKGIVQVWFLDASHGFAVGFPKTVLETFDGGKKWSKVAAADSAAVPEKQTIYEFVEFLGPHGVIVGRVLNRRADAQLPIWMDPADARNRREGLSTLVMLETGDSGKTWSTSIASLAGHLTEMHLSKDGFGIGLVQHEETASFPSNVYKVAMGKPGRDSVFAEKNRAVTDIALLPNGGAVVASVEPPGNSNQVPIPGKLKMLTSSNLKDWVEGKVDYRAVAQHAVLSAVDAHHVWVATDTGMILSLVSAR